MSERDTELEDMIKDVDSKVDGLAREVRVLYSEVTKARGKLRELEVKFQTVTSLSQVLRSESHVTHCIGDCVACVGCSGLPGGVVNYVRKGMLASAIKVLVDLLMLSEEQARGMIQIWLDANVERMRGIVLDVTK